MSTPLVASRAIPATSTRVALVAMTAIFFMWGFITELNGVLIPHLQVGVRADARAIDAAATPRSSAPTS